ncbi:MAG: hypothetical protein FWD71_17200 [Oscillospiraceae bacterium]|nr:hypothetical protein [Oscillospiraceae bacterium]
MATKPYRGIYVKKTYPNVWRGTCPSCKRTGVKLLWTKVEGESNFKVCKHCGNKK